MAKITVEMEIEDAQELASTAETMVNRIDWTLENRPPKASQQASMDMRAKQLTRAANAIKKALSERAKENVIRMTKK